MSETEIYQRQGFGNAMGFGQRPALLIVDFVVAFTDPAQFGGGNITDAVAQTVGLLAVARRVGIPVAHTRVVYADDGAAAAATSRLKLGTCVCLINQHEDASICSEV